MGLLLKISFLVSILEIAYVAAGESNCVVGNCPCHSKVINLNKPSHPIRNDVSVCCPPTNDEPCSEYFTAGDATEYDKAFCNCDYTKIYGTCLRGADQCHGKKESGRLNEMPVCCDDPRNAAFVDYNEYNDTYYCWCAPASNCLAEDDCSCNTKKIDTNPPNEPLHEKKVCCPTTDGEKCSKYLRVSDAYNSTSPATCTCDFALLKGTCLRGEQCDGKVIGGDLNGMPVCCKYSDEYISSSSRIKGTNDISCECSSLDPAPYAWTGNCLRGNACYHKEAVGLFNGAPVCCPNPGMAFNGIHNFGSFYYCNCESNHDHGYGRK